MLVRKKKHNVNRIEVDLEANRHKSPKKHSFFLYFYNIPIFMICFNLTCANRDLEG